MNKSIADPFDIATVFRDAASTMTCEHLEYFRPFTHDGTASKIPLCQVPDLVLDVSTFCRGGGRGRAQLSGYQSDCNWPTVLIGWQHLERPKLFVGPPVHKPFL